jgi:hypothetical protein
VPRPSNVPGTAEQLTCSEYNVYREFADSDGNFENSDHVRVAPGPMPGTLSSSLEDRESVA